MNENMQQREHVSALMDGAVEGDALSLAMDCAQQPEGREAWHIYHLVGDVLRSPELAAGADSQVFLARLQQRLAAEPAPAAPVAAQVSEVVAAPAPQAANTAVFRLKMAAGFASLAVVAAVGWNSWGSLQGNGPAATQLAVAAPAASGAQPASDASAAVMLRDPRLDELLAAHRQFGNTSALQMPAGFLRNATFAAPAR